MSNSSRSSSHSDQSVGSALPPGARELDGGRVRQVLVLDVGDNLAGKYLGAVIRETRYGNSKLHRFQIQDGVTVGVWGSADLNAKLGDAQTGDVVYLRHIGERSIGRGTMREYQVAVMSKGYPLTDPATLPAPNEDVG